MRVGSGSIESESESTSQEKQIVQLRPRKKYILLPRGRTSSVGEE